MRILVVEPVGDFMGHPGEYCSNLCQALAQLGHEVILCTNKMPVSQHLKAPPRFKIIEVANGRYAFKPFEKYRRSRPWQYYWGYLRCSMVIFDAALRLAQSGDFDVLYVLDVDRMVFSLKLLCSRTNYPPIVMELHAANFSFQEYEGDLIRKMYKLMQKEVLRRAIFVGKVNAIHVLGEWHVEKLRQQLGTPPPFPIVCVPEGVEIPAAQVDTVTARQRLGVNYNGTLFLFFGNLRRDKGLEDLLQATALVSSSDFRLLIVGYLADYSTEELTGMIRQLGLENKVLTRFEFISDEEMNLYAYASDAVIFPYRSSYKGGVGPLRKVRACGRPAIVTAVAEMGRITHLYNMGIVVEPDNPLSIAEGISRFIGMSSEERTKLANNALRFAEENTWRIMAAKLTELFDQVVHS
jgi:glycosyltransferase involved in cell wall biosynthesis